MSALKTRFAPSPSGLLHFGSVRTALFNALYAQKMGGSFLLRIEDTDQGRSKPEFVAALQDDLTWLGLQWQEGPIAQSQRGEIYTAHERRLHAAGSVYPCFCTALELELSRKVQAQSGKPPRYDGKCAHLEKTEQTQKLAEGVPHTLRFRMPAGGDISFIDIVRGPQKFLCADIGDFIIRRTDGSYAFFFVNAIDDALMGVTHVLRGEDHLTNTPRQIAMLQALNLTVPEYGHITLIVDAHGAPLSKRSGSLPVQTLRDQGYFPEAINNYLARLGHTYADNNLMTLSQLADAFELSHLGRAPAHYDARQLLHWQALAVQQADPARLKLWLGKHVTDLVPHGEVDEFVAAIRDNVIFPEDARLWAAAIYAETLTIAADAQSILSNVPSEFFSVALSTLDEQVDFNTLASSLKQSLGVNGKRLFQPLRAALTGQLHGPEMQRIFPLIGPARIRKRFKAHLS